MIDYTQLPNRDIACVDARSFYASCEAVARNLDPMTCLLVVVGDLERSGSIVLAASPRMKKEYGIKTGSRQFEIPRNPNILVVPARMGYYLDMSVRITQILTEFAPLTAIHQYSVDEAWIDLTGTQSLHGSPAEAAEKIRQRILEVTGIPTGVGIGPNAFLSKVALDVEGKKAGVAEWRYPDVRSKLWPVPVRDCWGIGGALGRRLGQIGVYTLGDLAAAPLANMERRFGVIGNQLWFHSWGVDYSRPGEMGTHGGQSFGKGITLLRDYRRRDEVRTVILELCDDVARRCRQAHMIGRTVNLGIGYSRYETGGGFSRSITLQRATNLGIDLYEACLKLLERHDMGHTVRQVNVALTNLTSADHYQLDLFSNREREANIARAVDAITDKFGPGTILRGCSFTAGGTAVDQRNKIGGHVK